MSRRDGACWRHPAQRAAGVCADCLKERLSALSPSAEASALPRRSWCSDRASAFGFVVLDRRKDSSDNLGSSSSANRLGSGDHGLIRGQKALSPLFSEAYLRRSKSWSHWEGGGSVGGGCPRQHWNNNGFAGRKSDAVLDDWTRQRFFSIFAKDQQQKEAHVFATSSNNRGTPQHFRGYELSKSASSKERAGHSLLRSTGATELNSNHTILENGSIEEGLSTEEAATAKKPRRTPAWLSSLLQLAFKRPRARPEAASDKKKEMGTSKVGSSNITGMFNKSKKAGEKQSKNAVKQANAKAATLDQAAEKQNVAGDDKQRFLNCKTPKQCTPSENSSWVRSISSPLRLFKHGQQQRRKNGTEEVQPARLSCSEEKSSWSIPPSAELKKLHPTPAYTAYYRDYGAWSLSSSPVPNGRWNNHGRAKQPWENRDISHASSSPYRVGSSTWNFYLTPLRPVKAATSSSKHSKILRGERPRMFTMVQTVQ